MVELIQLLVFQPFVSLFQAIVFLCAEPQSRGDRWLQRLIAGSLLGSLSGLAILALSIWLRWPIAVGGVAIFAAILLAYLAGLVAWRMEKVIRARSSCQ